MRDDAEASDFCRRLDPVGRILEMEGWTCWGCSPIEGPDGRVHVFFSRWPADCPEMGPGPMAGWPYLSEVGHAAADTPEGPYTFLGTAIPAGRGGARWDGQAVHNPTVHRIGDRYVIFHMGNSRPDPWPDEPRARFKALIETKRVGAHAADSLDGPWEPLGAGPLVEAGTRPSWDDAMTSNPAYLAHPDGRHFLYYKGMDFESWETRYGHRMYGLAVAGRPEGPYRKHPDNPIIDYPELGPGVEDGYAFAENGRFFFVMRDMGLFDHTGGLILESEDGIQWGNPKIAYYGLEHYLDESAEALERGNQLERPQILMREGRAAYLFAAAVGGRYGTASPVVLRLTA
ncbi:MAG: glycoside hydrolase family protein [Lentisphaerae bacterium]|nr:glycoside hydrolase family protein [Lentisphaerota bacterium]